ncbi:MAG: hypothetical protein IKT41_01380 [Clostridia bacterium]|nr:hypothetical protein [Clostridia bacterium]
MENASKALIMAGTILISIMVVSLGWQIINMFGEYAAGQEQERINQQIAEFNAQFLKYEGRTDITAQDIVTVANLAKENNEYYELTKADANENTYYIRVIAPGYDNFETHKTIPSTATNYNSKYLEEKNNFLSDKSVEADEIKYYNCNIGNVKVSSVTRRVYEITFTD